MVDALGLVASIIQLRFTGIKLSISLYEFEKLSSRTDASTTALAEELRLTCRALNIAQTLLKADGTESMLTVPAMNDAENIFADIKEVFSEIVQVLEKYPRVSNNDTIFWKVRERMRRSFREPKFDFLRRKLDSLTTSLRLLIEMEQLACDQATGEIKAEDLWARRLRIRKLYERKHAAMLQLRELEHNTKEDDGNIRMLPIDVDTFVKGTLELRQGDYLAPASLSGSRKERKQFFEDTSTHLAGRSAYDALVEGAETTTRVVGSIDAVSSRFESTANLEDGVRPTPEKLSPAETSFRLDTERLHQIAEETVDTSLAYAETLFSDKTRSVSGDMSLAGITLADTQAHAAEVAHTLNTNLGTDGFDYMSVASNDGEIASQAPRRKTAIELLAVKRFGALFAELDNLRALHEDLLTSLGTSRFVANYRRALKVYVLSLKKEAHTALEKDAVKVIEHRVNRQTIASHIVDHVIQEDSGSRSKLKGLADQEVRKQTLEDWAKNVYGQPELAPMMVDGPEEESGDDGDDQDEALGESQLKTMTTTNVDKALRFLRKDAPIRTLTMQLRLLSLPSLLRDIIDTTPKCALELFDEDSDIDRSVVNSYKSLIEESTMTPWDWWPLQPRIPNLTPGHSLLKWEICRETLYTEIGPRESVAIRHILDEMGEHTSGCHRCKEQSAKLDWSTLMKGFRASFASRSSLVVEAPSQPGGVSLSKASSRYTPNGLNPGSLASFPVQGPPPVVALGQSYHSSVSVQANMATGGNIASDDMLCVVFGIEHSQGFHAIENIETDAQLTDSSFFQELKAKHKQHRWRFHHYFSPYVFRYCRFVQFEEVLDEQISCVGDALPDEHGYAADYEYKPRPPAVTRPLIHPVVFSVLLRACDPLCYWSALPACFHKCRRISADRRYLARIPQKKGVYNAPSSQVAGVSGRVAFGIQASYMPSFARLFVYHVSLILSGFAFWIYWLKQYPSDLQNASVPLFTIIMLIGTFWALLGKRLDTM